ncbi:MAG: SH3-like domain-containing protein [Gaiellaceae bacterium]
MSFACGDTVRVSGRRHEGHHRTPAYLKGRTGTVKRVHERRFLDPETRAYGGDGTPARRLYLVAFELAELGPTYDGGADDRLLVDVFEHWLEEPR